MTIKGKRGGKRKGAGRPLHGSKKKVMKTYRLATDVVELLNNEHEPASQIIEQSVRMLINLKKESSNGEN